MILVRAMRVAGLLALLAATAGCVTTVVEGKTFTADKQQEIERRVDAASQYLEKGNTEQAIFHLKKALDLDPNSAPIHVTLAQVFWQTGEYELADENFRRAIAIDGKMTRARNNYAAFLYARGKNEDAIKELELVVADTLYEKRADSFTNLGKAYLKAGRAEEAEQAFERAVRMDRRQGMAFLELAELYRSRGDVARAQSLYSRFRATTTQQSPRSLLLGIQIARASGDRDAEASLVLQLKGRYPESPEYREYQATLSGT